jgi:Uma2 family endonuclease
MKTANRVTKRKSLRIPEVSREGPYTFDDFLAFGDDGTKADLLDGVIYVASPDNTDSSDLNTWLGSIMAAFVDFRVLGKVYFLKVAYRIGPKRGPEPDIGFVPTELEHTRRRGYIDGPPALAVEIVSPDSVERDYIKKYALYEEAGVREYWIIDPDAGKATFLRLHGKRFKEVKPVKHIFKSEVLPGFSVDVRWLFAANRPRAYDVLQGLLRK